MPFTRSASRIVKGRRYTRRFHSTVRSHMSRALGLWLIVTLLSTSTPAYRMPGLKASTRSAHQAEKKKGGRRDGELIVRFREGVSEQDKKALVEGKGVRRAGRLRGRSRLEKLETQKGQDVETLAADLRKSPAVELAEPNYLIGSDEVVPDDPSFNEQWALRNTGATGGQPGADIRAVSAWGVTTGAATTVIAVIDSGIDFTHPDLQNNRWTNNTESADGSDNDGNGLVDDLHGWDWVRNSGAVVDEQGHGTIVAGIIAAQGNNGAGTTGVMWRAGLMSLRVLDNTGTGNVADAVEAIDYAAEHGAQVINCSWGTNEESFALRDAIQRAATRGVVIVSSAGNSGQDIEAEPYYPSSFGFSNQISVAATDNFDRLAPWSNYGAAHVTVAAPGVNILTTKMGGGYTTVTGTSAATPIVTGVAGLIKTQRWWLSAPGTRTAIQDGARAVAELTGKVSTGGVVNAAGALAALLDPGPEPTPTPTPTPGGGGAGTTEDEADEHLPDLNAERNRVPPNPVPPSQIHADLPCLDCDPCGGSCDTGGEMVEDPDFAEARLEPQNATGQTGVTLGSRNFNWSIPLVGLPGRSGLDLNVDLNYNSLVWTKFSGYVRFDADRGQPTAGFRIGLPVIQQRYRNRQTNIYNYIMVMPSGRRVELRQVGTSNIYESADNLYTQMTDNGTAGAIVRTSDGAQLTFVPSANNELRCTQIKDRNGNFITATYNSTGRITTIKDTLGRVITFHYDTSNYLTSITQTWGGATHYWAKFYYGTLTIQTNFTGMSVLGPQNGTSIGVLNQVWLHDGTRYYFDYTSWGQVWKIRRNSADDDPLSYTAYNLPGSPLLATSAQTDCPRFTERREWAVDWTGANGLPAEAVTTYSVDPGGAWSQYVTPNNVTYKELYATSGWQTGLITGTEVYFGGVKRKWMAIAWTQDEPSLTYQKNARPYEITTQDEATNKRKVHIDYYPSTSFSLPKDVLEYDVNVVNNVETPVLLKKSHTDYNLSATYNSATRRILGLAGMVTVYDGSNNLVLKVEYQYDEGGAFFDTSEGAPTQQHDSTNFGATLIAGRGNLTSVRRWNVDFPTDSTKVSETNSGYNIAGSVTRMRDANLHESLITYADNFSVAAKNSLNTLAYPKTVTDPDDFVSTTQYNYDTGAMTKTTSPTSGTGTAITYADVSYTYDSVGRLFKITDVASGAYTRWVYPTTNLLIQQYQTISGTAEAYSAQVLDGAGRVRGVATDHTFSGTATASYSGQYFIYDIMGRLWKQSNPTEFIPDATTGAWNAAGDDATVGWKYTTQTYDWQDRPLVTTNPDNTSRTNTYGGCGCAGGEQITSFDERGRKRVFSKDAQGRLAKVEEMLLNGTLYRTTTYTYDTLDHLTQINQGGQLRTFDYDGHGRVISRTTPEQGTTIYVYNKDDTVQKVTDARGVTTTFGYNARHLPTGMTYTLPTGGGGVAATPNATFAYDAAGNRTSMTEKNSAGTVVGSSAYHYDSLSRMDYEERFFQGVGTYRLSYEYNLGGELTSLTAPSQFGSFEVGYTYDKVGRTAAVTGSGYGGGASYVNSISYRAFGAAKQVAYGNSKTLSMTYDTRLRLTRWDVPGALGWTYAFNTPNIQERTGRVAFANNLYDATLDRSYAYDDVGYLGAAHSGNEANGHAGYTSWPAAGTVPTGPYAENYIFDQWGNMTWRNGWGVPNAQYAYSPQFSNNKMTVNPVTGAAVTYDLAGNLTNDGMQAYTYYATGQQATASGTTLSQTYDGDGLRVKKTEDGVTTCYLRSSVLGKQVVMEITGSIPVGQMVRGYVFLGGQMLAVQQGDQVDGVVNWVHQDPVTKSQRLTSSTGSVVSWVDLDPWGGETGRSVNQSQQPHRFTNYERDTNGGDEAMMRRYESKWVRFAQPDPYDGSYDLSDPLSLNRYVYVNNDPVNFTDPTGLCTFNVNLSGVSGQQLSDMKDEMRRIFASGGHSVVFGLPSLANGGSMNLSVVSQYTGADANVITSQGGSYADRNVLGVTVPNSGNAFVNSSNIAINNHRWRFSSYTASIGTQYGRVGAHEVIQHGFLGIPPDGLLPDVGRPGDMQSVVAPNTARYNINSVTAAALGNLCLRPIEQGPLNINNNPIPRRPLARPGMDGISHRTGGGFGGVSGGGGVGALSWLSFIYYLRGREYTEVLGYHIVPPR